MVLGVNSKWHVDLTNYSGGGGAISECSYTITWTVQEYGAETLGLREVTPLSTYKLVKLTTRLFFGGER